MRGIGSPDVKSTREQHQVLAVLKVLYIVRKVNDACGLPCG